MGGGGCTAQPVTTSANAATTARDNPAMWLILVEALGAGLILVGIVWWTMFSGRRGGERRVDPTDQPTDQPPIQPGDEPPAR